MAAFVPRTTAPTTDNDYYYKNNVFYQSGYGLPNCTAYAWGRFYELTGTRPELCIHNAEDWYAWNDPYSRGKTPKLGAVIVWGKGAIGDESDGAGHVAVVEEINANGSFRTSNSGYGGSLFWMEDVPASCARSGYDFLGFIYCPVTWDNGGGNAPDPVTKSEVKSGNYYLSLSEMKVNARYIYEQLSPRGWSVNAVAGMLGNFQAESTINPGIWESLDEGDTAQGYGLVQWTPATKYMDWCNARNLTPSDMDSALSRIEWELANSEQYYATDAYPLSFAEFKTSTKDPYYLGMAFVTNYERPAEISTARGDNAQFWYDYLIEVYGTTPPGGGGTIPRRSPMPVWMKATLRRRYYVV